MAELNSLEELGGATEAAEVQAPVYVQKLDDQGRAYATGKRKDAVARVWIQPGTGRITAAEALDDRHGSIPRADVAEAIAEAVARPDTYGRTLELTQGDTPVADALAST